MQCVKLRGRLCPAFGDTKKDKKLKGFLIPSLAELILGLPEWYKEECRSITSDVHCKEQVNKEISEVVICFLSTLHKYWLTEHWKILCTLHRQL